MVAVAPKQNNHDRITEQNTPRGGCALSRESQKHDNMSHGPYLPHHYGKIFTYRTLITPLSMR